MNKYRFWLGVYVVIGVISMSGCTNPDVETIKQPIPTPINLGNAQFPIKEGEESLDKVRELYVKEFQKNQANMPTQKPTPDSTPTQIPQQNDFPKKPLIPGEAKVIISTNKGDLKIDLDSNNAPLGVSNFIEKIKSNFYQNLKFHRVEDWVIQGGDPTGTGSGGDTLATEITDKPFKEGSIGLARGSNKNISNDAQFFICTQDCAFLTGSYTNLGEVTEGLDIAKQITVGDTIQSISIAE